MFFPRADQPERGDQQHSFFHSRHAGPTFLIGGNGAGCLGAEQPVYDPVAGVSRPVSQIDGPFHVLSRTSDGYAVVAKASAPRIYGIEDLYEITLSTGVVFIATLGHRVLTPSGWQEIGQLVAESRQLLGRMAAVDLHAESPPLACESLCAVGCDVAIHQFESHSNCTRRAIDEVGRSPTSHAVSLQSEALRFSMRQCLLEPDALWWFRECARHLFGKPSDSTDHYCWDHRRDGGQPQFQSSSDQGLLPRQGDVLARSHLTPQIDDLACKQEHNRLCRFSDRPSMSRFARQVRRDLAERRRVSSSPCLRSSRLGGIQLPSSRSNTVAIPQTPTGRPVPEVTCRQNRGHSSSRLAKASCLDAPSLSPAVVTSENATHITSIKFLRRDSYWDFSVEEYENYWAAGVWHHNTSETMVAKVADFVLQQQPPPRRDTPFWLIGGSYKQTGNTLWKEKMLGHGHIPTDEVEWDRVSWEDKKQGRPASVPLKPWPSYAATTYDDYVPDANWVLHFKSWRQGWQQMSAESIGGFAFSEQFPWMLFQEVFRGCREYSFTGNKLAEFTPIHPDLSFELQEMIETDALPPSWAVYRANTECALEAGHVSEQWYQDFFGMIPDEILPIRQRGDFGGFEGTIYPSFSVAKHVRNESHFLFSPGCKHLRAIDWGSGGEHPFACLWGYRDVLGRYWIYDEYEDENRLTVPDYLDNVDQRSREWEWDDTDPHFGQTWADTSDPASMLMASQFDKHVVDARQISIAGAKKSVRAGIQHVQLQLKSQAKWGGPGLFIHERCRNLIREMRIYRWLRSADHGGLNPRAARCEPLKVDDHLVDCLRYMIYSEAHASGMTIQTMSHAHGSKRYQHGVQLQRGS